MKRLLLGAFVVACLLPAAPASAHAAYKASDPSDEATVGAAPSSIWAEFTEPLADGSYLRVLDPCGRRVDQGSTEIFGYRMSVGSAGGAAGIYRVRYFALSSLDSHPVNGEFTFTVTSGRSCGGGTEAASEQEETRSRGSRSRDESSQRRRPRMAASDDGDVTVAARGAGNRTASKERMPTGTRKGAGGDRSRSRAGRDAAPQPAPGASLAAASLIRGIPWLWFFVSLGIAALIGAAGGKIYADLVSPPQDD